VPYQLRFDDPDAVDDPLFARYATITFGAPGRCPECDTFGQIEREDLFGHWQNQRCPSCGTRWQYRFDDAGAIQEVREVVPEEELDLRGAAAIRAIEAIEAAEAEAARAGQVLDLPAAEQAARSETTTARPDR